MPSLDTIFHKKRHFLSCSNKNMKTRLIPKKSTFQKKKKQNYRAKSTANHLNPLRKNHRIGSFLPNLMSNGSTVKKIKSNAKIVVSKKLM